MTQPDELRAQRDQARTIAVHLEQENARLTETVIAVRNYANGLIATWGAEGHGLDLLRIINGENSPIIDGAQE